MITTVIIVVHLNHCRCFVCFFLLWTLILFMSWFLTIVTYEIVACSSLFAITCIVIVQTAVVTCCYAVVSCPGPNRQTRFYQHFQRSRNLSVGLRPPSWLSVSQYKFSREKFIVSRFKYNVLSLFLAHHISSLFNIT